MAESEAETKIEQEVINPADDARNDVAAAIKQLKGDAPAEPEIVAGEPPEVESDKPAEDGRARGPDGKFIAKTEAAPVEAAPVETKSPPVDNTAKASTEQPSTAVGAPPVSWAADAKQVWASLPPAAQNAVLKREAEVSNGFKQKSEEVRRYEAAISPIAQEASRVGMSVEQGINSLLSAHARLQQDPAGFIVDVAKRAGIDLAALASNPPAPQRQAAVEQAVPQYDPRVSQLESMVQGFLQNQTMGVVESFAKNQPHWAAVEGDIAQILPMVKQANPGLSHQEILQKAYDQAIWINPEVRASLIAEQQTKAETDRLAALKVKEAASKKAAVSVRGSSNGAMPPPKVNSTGDVYDDVRAAINQLRQ